MVALVLTACGGNDSEDGEDESSTEQRSELQRVTGTFTLLGGGESTGSWANCSGLGGYDDFAAGMDVTVRNESGTVIASTSMRNLSVDDSKAIDTALGSVDGPFKDEAAQAIELEGFACTLVFVADVKPADFYTFEAGNRGDLTYSAAELEAADWHVELSLGG